MNQPPVNSDDRSNVGDADPPRVTLLQLMTGYWVSQAIYVAAKLGIADLLAAGPVGSEELARTAASHAPSLYRVLRALASVGIFTETSPRRFGLTPLAALLRGLRDGWSVVVGEGLLSPPGRVILVPD